MSETKVGCPGFFVSALRGGSGKTLLTIGLSAAFKALGKKTAPFKKGPDYIDAGWLSLAAGRPCYNLDTYLISESRVLHSYLRNTVYSGVDIAVIEGNRGLFDGIDLQGLTSTAETAKLLGLPVILCLDCTKSTRTMAAAVLGCLHFDPDVTIGGVILNRVAGPRHRDNVAQNILHHTGVPVLGAIPKLRSHDFPERHMGLVPTAEHDWANQSIRAAEQLIRENVDLDRVLQMAVEHSRPHAVSEVLDDPEDPRVPADLLMKDSSKPVIGVVRDSAFQFYYPENLEALEKNGARLVYISPLKDSVFPDLDGLYIGGGFPETHARELAANEEFRRQIKARAEKGFPVYAECGGLMYLGRELVMNGETYPMVGLFPLSFGLSEKPQGHGYVVAEVTRDNPYFETGLEIRGHEFRYSRILSWDEKSGETALTMKRGTGMKDRKDGICYNNVFASYTHIHALGVPGWAPSFVRRAKEYKALQVSS